MFAERSVRNRDKEARNLCIWEPAERHTSVFWLGARNAQASLGLDLAAVNADGTHTLPFPTVVVEAAGMIRWVGVHPDCTTRSEPAPILGALDAALSDN